tara:strand:+ start:186 stop:383 length:198 start_codon:yes stop_codon:yes gene_type:complete
MLNLFRNIFKVQDKLMLGRWNYTKCNNELERKIYLANYDHCGPCGKIKLEKNNLRNNINETYLRL